MGSPSAWWHWTETTSFTVRESVWASAEVRMQACDEEMGYSKQEGDQHGSHKCGADLLPNGHRAGLPERFFHRLASACGALLLP